MRQKQPASEVVLASEEPVRYRLTFRTTEDGVPAELTSPLLDRAMHGRGGARTYFRSVSGLGEHRRIALDAFEGASLAVYLQSQQTVRRQLERELDNLLQTWDEQMLVGRGGEVWNQTKIESVHFEPRQLPTSEQVQMIKRTYKRGASRILRKEFDTTDSRSSFLIMIQPRWAEHLLMVQFRDGKAMDLTVHG